MVCRGQIHLGLEAPQCARLDTQKKTKEIVAEFDRLFAQARPAFNQERVFQRAHDLAVNSLLALGKRTVTGVLSAGGRQFQDWSAAYRMFEMGRIRQTYDDWGHPHLEKMVLKTGTRELRALLQQYIVHPFDEPLGVFFDTLYMSESRPAVGLFKGALCTFGSS